MSNASASVVKTTENYYDSGDADNFYFHIWGGEDLHIGIYNADGESIRDASRRTVETIGNKFAHLPRDTRVLDLGAGYGGSARQIAAKYGFHFTCLNLSKVQNERNRGFVREAGLEDRIEVVTGNFEELPFADRSFDAIWSQDAFLHSARRFRIFEEADRVLRPGGEIVFTDPMQVKGADPEALKPVLDRLQLPSMGSVEVYADYAKKLGWQVISVDAMPEQLVTHYSRVLAELEARDQELAKVCSTEYRARMRQGLQHWIEAGSKGLLNWGILHYRKS